MSKTLRALAGLALAGTVGVLTVSAAAGAPLFGATSATSVAVDPETGLVQSMSSALGGPIAFGGPGTAGSSPEAAAIAFLTANRLGFGLQAAASGLAATRTLEDGAGRTVVRVQQLHNGLPVLGAMLNVQLDGARNVLSVNGKSAGSIGVDTVPEVAASDAVRRAVEATARYHRVSKLRLQPGKPELAIHDPRVMGGPARPPHAVWKVEVTSDAHPDIKEFVLIDAKTGRVAVQFNNRAHAAPANATQRVCDAVNTSQKYPCTSSVDVAKPSTSKIADVKNAYVFAEHTYDFFARRFGRNSLDNKGLILKSTVRWVPENCGADCPGGKYANAFWDDSQMVYGADYASADDVVGHELSHGFTHFTSALFYYYQSGAINESLSDIFGEFIDQANGKDGSGGTALWAMGEDLPIGAIRSMSDPTRFNDPDRMQSSLYTADPNFFDRGGVHTNSGVGNKTAYLMTDKSKKTFNGQTITGLGVDKSAAIWYRVNTLYLNSGSDYADLGIALQQACKDLIGKTPRTQKGKLSPDGAITSANCLQVKRAVTATELTKPPLVHPIPAEAPVCTSGTPKNKLVEAFEGTKFKFKPSDTSHWYKSDEYAASNKHAMGAADAAGDPVFDTQLTQTTAITIPANAFLRFAHFYNLYTDTAGGVVEYQIAGTTAWKTFSSTSFTHNGYNATLLRGYSNKLEGKKAFSGFSGGWTSSRIKLTALEGKKVKFRFRVTTGIFGAWDTWLLDDIRVFSCT